MTKKLSDEKKYELLNILEERFKNHMERHAEVKWEDVRIRIEAQLDVLWSLYEMERTGGEPDVIGNNYIYVDCAPESPKGRRKLCYDREALENRKKNKPENDVMTVAEEMGIELLDEEEYRALQKLGEFDLKTSSWIRTPNKIRKLGGALFCDRRYDHVFVYHNGADSYYASRGFRGKLRF